MNWWTRLFDGISASHIKDPEERYAKTLYADLASRFGSSTKVDIGGGGVQWHCTAARADLSCRIHCFNASGPEYYTKFQRSSQEIATARTSDRSATVSAVSDWLDAVPMAVLYDRYSFVDARKRSLIGIGERVSQCVPELAHASGLMHRGDDFYQLQFKKGDRSSLISFYGYNSVPDAKFSWDDCTLFAYQPTSDLQLASVLKRWILDRAQPSEMRREFPTLEIGSLADFYEQGRPIEGEFIHSWDSIETFYQQEWCKFSGPVLAMIREMRSAGYDRLLRAGQSLSSLGLSRSRRHGLRDKQPCVWFEFHESDMNVHARFAAAELRQQPIQLTPEVREILELLVRSNID